MSDPGPPITDIIQRNQKIIDVQCAPRHWDSGTLRSVLINLAKADGCAIPAANTIDSIHIQRIREAMGDQMEQARANGVGFVRALYCDTQNSTLPVSKMAAEGGRNCLELSLVKN